MNPFQMFPMGNGGQNPFGYHQYFFDIDCVHEDSGVERKTMLGMTVPITVTELQARRALLDMAYQQGVRIKHLNRIDDQFTMGQ